MADLNSRDRAGRTSLMYAIVDDDLDKARALIRYGADVNAQDNNGMRTCLSRLREAKENASG